MANKLFAVNIKLLQQDFENDCCCELSKLVVKPEFVTIATKINGHLFALQILEDVFDNYDIDKKFAGYCVFQCYNLALDASNTICVNYKITQQFQLVAQKMKKIMNYLQFDYQQQTNQKINFVEEKKRVVDCLQQCFKTIHNSAVLVFESTKQTETRNIYIKMQKRFANIHKILQFYTYQDQNTSKQQMIVFCDYSKHKIAFLQQKFCTIIDNLEKIKALDELKNTFYEACNCFSKEVEKVLQNLETNCINGQSSLTSEQNRKQNKLKIQVDFKNCALYINGQKTCFETKNKQINFVLTDVQIEMLDDEKFVD